jgi:putative PIN family toxin of toxin-antitoxin system
MIWNGPPRRVIDLAAGGEISLHTSPALLKELGRVLAYPKLADALRARNLEPEALLRMFAAAAELWIPEAFEPVILEDPADDEVLACALAAKVNAIVSGDRHLVALRSFAGIPILTPSELLDTFQQRLP